MTLTLNNIGKCYGKNWALHNVNLSASSGLIGLIGPNGAGKTTLLRIMAAMLPPTRGSTAWHGHDIFKQGFYYRSRLGYLPQNFGIYPALTTHQFLSYLATLKGLPQALIPQRIAWLEENFNLNTIMAIKMGALSQGMVKRVGIAQALLNDPEIIILDEPTASLDPEERIRLRTILAEIAQHRLIIFSSHIITDVEAVAETLWILNHGQIVAACAPAELINQAQGLVWQLQVDSISAQQFRQKYPVSAMVLQPGGVILRLLSTDKPDAAATPVSPTLEEAYLIKITSLAG